MNKLFAALAAFALMATANATTITFEDAAGNVTTSSGATAGYQYLVYGTYYESAYGGTYGSVWSESGVRVALTGEYDHAHITGSYGSSAGFDIHGGYGIRVNMNGAMFSLTSFDTYIKYGNWILTGSNGTSVALGGDYYSYGAVTHGFGSAFSNISWFTLTGGDNELEIDNIVIDGGAVPEPASLALVGLSIVGLGFARRRKA
ncbi:MAG: PEP-CTERM sorting domain-containing protein [Rhodocyclaceae bacterium]